MELSEDAERIMGERGLLRPGGRIARKIATERVGQFLVERKDAGASVDSICSTVFGTIESAVKQVVASLTALDGPVQKWINGRGGVLIIRRETETLKDADGNPVRRSVTKRYIVEDPEAIWNDLMLPLVERNTLSAERAARIVRDFILPRRPELKSRIADFKARLTAGLAEKLAALPFGETAAD